MAKTKKLKSTDIDAIESIVDLIVDDAQRIKENTQKYRNMSIAEAFADFYNMSVNTDITENEVKPVSIGDYLIGTLIMNTKNNTIFESSSAKGRLVSRIDLSKYPFVKLGSSFRVKVIDKCKDGFVVDPFAPIFEEWLDHNIKAKVPVQVEGLKSVNNRGYVCKVNVAPLTQLVGKKVMVDAFIPGSQIVLNIERNFERWNGSTVTALIDSYVQRPYTNDMSVVCSVKSYLEQRGNAVKVEWFKVMTEEGKEWENLKSQVFNGVVTGVVNTSKRCGVFVEIPSVNVTTFIPYAASELVSFNPGLQVNVQIEDITSPTFYNSTLQQVQHVEPYKIDKETGVLYDVNVDVKFKFAEK